MASTFICKDLGLRYDTLLKLFQVLLEIGRMNQNFQGKKDKYFYIYSF
jgi:hypothetical protein